MNTNDLRSQIQSVISHQHNNAILYFITNDGLIYEADLEQVGQARLLNYYKEAIENTLVTNQEYELMNLSEQDERKDVIFKYDYEEQLEIFNFFEKVLSEDDIPTCPINTETIKKIIGVIIVYGNTVSRIVIYQKYFPIQVIKKDVLAFIKGERNRLKVLDGDILKLSQKIHSFYFDEEVYVLDVNILEQLGFHELITKRATENVHLIGNLGLLVNTEMLSDGIGDLAVARKLARIISNSPVLRKEISNEAIIEFIKGHKVLSKKIKVTDDGTQISICTKVARKHFIELLYDNYLHSQLTDSEYASKAKDSLED